MDGFDHSPVLADECLTYLAVKKCGTYIDGTVGGAGHALRILEALSGKGSALIGIDRDETAATVSLSRLKAKNEDSGGYVRCEVIHSNYVYIDKICNDLGITEADGILFDLGASSHQFDETGRGFSYRGDAPLDMRMDRGTALTAADIVNGYPERELAGVLFQYGEERWAARIAKFIAAQRARNPIVTTQELVDVIFAAVPKGARRDGPHPARRTFQALRIEVNNELGVIAEAIKKSVKLLKKGGRLCVISFHSLEDRIVKKTFEELSKGCVCPADMPVCACGGAAEIMKVTRKPVTPSEEELSQNPRARSAKLRVAEKI